MNCTIISPEASQEFKNAASVTLPAVNGELEILPGHAECFIELVGGAAVAVGGQQIPLAAAGGVCHVQNDEVVVIA